MIRVEVLLFTLVVSLMVIVGRVDSTGHSDNLGRQF